MAWHEKIIKTPSKHYRRRLGIQLACETAVTLKSLLPRPGENRSNSTKWWWPCMLPHNFEKPEYIMPRMP